MRLQIIRGTNSTTKRIIEAGIFGAYIVPRVLRDYGYFDIAWEMVCKEDYPGWIYMMNQSHGDMAEQWNGSSSLDHHMYTAVDGFIQESLSGLDFNLGKTELQQLYLKPYFPRGMKKFSFWHQFHEGKIEISWDMETYRVVLPEGMEATLELAGEKYVLKAGENVFNKDI